MEIPYKFVCIDCNTPVTRWGELEPGVKPERCLVCWWLVAVPDMDDKAKEQLRAWGNGESNQREDTIPPDPDAVLPHSDLLGKPTPP